jgi:20S proteasome alpha/beta subunit
MTTIAYKDGIIAYDSRSTQGDLIASDTRNKGRMIEGVFFVFTGALSDTPKFVELYFGRTENHKGVECNALVVDKGVLWEVGVSPDTGMWKLQTDITEEACVAIGSGWHFAYAAMDLGQSAAEGVAAAIKRDSKSGGQIRCYNISMNKIFDWVSPK